MSLIPDPDELRKLGKRGAYLAPGIAPQDSKDPEPEVFESKETCQVCPAEIDMGHLLGTQHVVTNSLFWEHRFRDPLSRDWTAHYVGEIQGESWASREIMWVLCSKCAAVMAPDVAKAQSLYEDWRKSGASERPACEEASMLETVIAAADGRAKVFGVRSPEFDQMVEDERRNPRVIQKEPRDWDGHVGISKLERAIRQDDQKVLTEVAMYGKLRGRAIGYVRDQALLKRIALNDENMELSRIAGLALKAPDDRREFFVRLNAWNEKQINAILARAPINRDGPAYRGTLISRGGGSSAEAWQWLAELFADAEEKEPWQEVIASGLNTNTISLDRDLKDKLCLSGWLRSKDSPHNTQTDQYYTVSVEAFWIGRTDNDAFEWALASYSFTAST